MFELIRRGLLSVMAAAFVLLFSSDCLAGNVPRDAVKDNPPQVVEAGKSKEKRTAGRWEYCYAASSKAGRAIFCYVKTDVGRASRPSLRLM